MTAVTSIKNEGDHGMDMKLELVAIPVTDVDRAKAFYVDKVGFHADHDHTVSDQIRFVQLTPPGSACSIALGKGLPDAASTSARFRNFLGASSFSSPIPMAIAGPCRRSSGGASRRCFDRA